MKKFIYIIILLGTLVNAEGQCTLNNTATDPNPSYTQPTSSYGSEYKTNRFNWWNEGLNQIGPINTNITGFPSIPYNYVTSPYLSSNVSYLAELVNNKDFESLPQNGWELIKQDMGYFINPGDVTEEFGSTNGGTTSNYSPTALPYYIIYNKYSGILRVFFLRNDAMSSFAAVAVTLSFSAANSSSASNSASGLYGTYSSYSSAILANDIQQTIADNWYPSYVTGSTLPNSSFPGVMQPLDQIATSQSATSIAVCPTDPTHWSYADFQMAYDPCTCFYSSAIHVDFAACIHGTIEATGVSIGNATTYNGTNSQLSTFNGSLSPYSPAYLSSFYQGDQGDISVLALEFNNANDIAAANSTATTSATSQLFTGLSKFGKAAADLFAIGFAGGNNGAVTSGQISSGGSAITDAYNFISWAGSVNSPQQGTSFLISLQEAINGTLSINRSVADASVDISAPGSLGAESSPQYTQLNVTTALTPEYPEYNNTLGLFAALHSPTVNVFQQVFTDGSNHGGVIDGLHYEMQFSNLDYAFNPIVDASNTKVLAQIEYYIPIAGGAINNSVGIASYSETTITNLLATDYPYPQDTGIIRFITPTVPLGCLSNLPSVLDLLPPDESLVNISSVEAFIDLYVFYTFQQDAYGTVHTSFQKLKYPIKFNTVSSTLISGSPFNYNDYATVLNIPSTTFTTSQTISSLGTINITGDLINSSSGNVIIQGSEINVLPGVTVNPGIILQIQPIPDFCANSSSMGPTTADANYCYATVYKANQVMTKRNFTDTAQLLLGTDFSLNLYPNPSTDICHLVFTMSSSATASADLIDMTGRLVRPIMSGSYAQGPSRIDFSTADVAPGAYMVRYIDGNGNTANKSLVVSHGEK